MKALTKSYIRTHRKIFAVFAMASFPFMAASAFAHTSDDWDKTEAEFHQAACFNKSGPQTAPEQVATEIRAKIVSPVMPGSLTTIDTRFPDSPSHYQRGEDGFVREWIGTQQSQSSLLDPTGLIYLSCTASLSLSGAFSPEKLPPSFAYQDHELATAYLENTTGDTDEALKVMEMSCQDTPKEPDEIQEHCTETFHTSFHNHTMNDEDSANERPQSKTIDDVYKWYPDSKIFAPADNVADWRENAEPWHSQIVSAGLSAAQKDQARALFSRGFDLFKAGDLVGSRALFESGMKIDPGNYLAWFTLGEIARSAAVQNPDDRDAATAEKLNYSHTIDLAPDSPEAALAKGYLDALH